MHLSDDDCRQFQAIWKAEFKEEISLAQARLVGSQVLELYVLLAKYAAKRERQH